MKTEYIILIAVALIGIVVTSLQDEVKNGPERVALLEHKVDKLLKAHDTVLYHKNKD